MTTLDEPREPLPEGVPTITAMLRDGPLGGSRIESEIIHGRAPSTIEIKAGDETTCRYCLEGLVQSGRSAAYTFLYRV